MDQRLKALIIVVVVVVGAAAGFRYFSSLDDKDPGGAVSCYGSVVNAGNQTAIATGTFSVWNGASLIGSDSLGASGWDLNLNPDSYTGYWEASSYYPASNVFTVPTGIQGTRTHLVDSLLAYPVSADYDILFQSSTTVLASLSESTQSDTALACGTTEASYSLTLTNNDDYSSLGLPEETTHPIRESVYNYLMISFNTTSVVLSSDALVKTIPADGGKIFFLKVPAAVAGAGAAGQVVSITLQFTSTGGYDLDISYFVFTNLAQIEKYSTGHAPTGYTLATYAIATDIGVTVS